MYNAFLNTFYSMEALNIFDIHHDYNRLFSFKTSRPKLFRFKNDKFAMLSIEHDMNIIYKAFVDK